MNKRELQQTAKRDGKVFFLLQTEAKHLGRISFTLTGGCSPEAQDALWEWYMKHGYKPRAQEVSEKMGVE